MTEILKNIFGLAVREEKYMFPSGTPMYVSYGYEASRISLENMSCILIKPKNEGYTLSSLKKQLGKIREICGEPVVVELKRLSALQRTNLIESGIPFVAGSGQIFIPFWGSYFEERICNPPKPVEKMSANAQLVFLYLFYKNAGKNEKVNQTRLSEELNMDKMTCSRAIRQLRSMNLISVFEEGTSNFVTLENGMQATVTAHDRMESPIHKKVFVRRIPKSIDGKLCGIKALSKKTMISALDSDAGYAISKKEFRKMDPAAMIDEQTFRDFGGEIIEVWKYDPALLSDEECVDDVSLILELQGEKDERIQKELDSIRGKYGMEVDQKGIGD
ncbi:MAG: hypothetical protein J6Z33_03370 [Lachnospiraceae bacterium]|nr:hypothetical protein [Lachnospiraceae bacterium]